MSVTAADGQEPDIRQLVSRHTALRPHGVDQLRGACLFCGSSAFRVRPECGTFHCFGCGVGGDVAVKITS